jgi:CheY-specific phosphatase CheX
MHITITVESIHNANAQFWEQMLAMQLEPIGETELRCMGAEHVMGSCNLSGVWTGCVEVRLSRGLAVQATSAMLMKPIEQVQASDTLDAIKEIANMIAGTIKSALPRPCVMTVPFAEVACDDFCILPKTHDSVSVFFRHDTGELMVRVWEQAREPNSETGQLAQLCS